MVALIHFATTIGSPPVKGAMHEALILARLFRLCLAIAALAILLWDTSAAAQSVRITKLTDVAFGAIANLTVDAVRSQSVCAFSNSATKGYNVRANGSGAGGAFTLASGIRTLVYEVQWNGTAGQSSGSSLTPNVARTGFVSIATASNCGSGPANSGSLIVILRAADLSSATAGSYTGTLTLVLAPE